MSSLSDTHKVQIHVQRGVQRSSHQSGVRTSKNGLEENPMSETLFGGLATVYINTPLLTASYFLLTPTLIRA